MSKQEEDLKIRYKEETGKNAIWRGEETKGYLKWKETQSKSEESMISDKSIETIARKVFELK
ncbi:MAG: hypothetical protein ACFFDB_00280 [Promethearchaeota archaeon]